MASNDDADLIAAYIDHDVRERGAYDARLKESGVPVWALIGYLRAVNGSIAQTARDYDIPVQAVEAAQAYYRQHHAVIDAWLTLNATPDADDIPALHEMP